MSAPTSQPHPLRSTWTLSSSKTPSEAQVAAENNDYDAAQRKASKKIGLLSTIEQLWTTINSLPQPSQLPNGDSLIFARDGVEPAFSSFPNGTRIGVTCNLGDNMGKFGYEHCLALVLGECVTEVTEGKAVVDVVRAKHKAYRNWTQCTCIELWLSDKVYLQPILQHIKPLLQKQFPTIEVMELPMRK